MRIAHVTDCYLPRLGGIERQVFGLASAQQELGHDVEVITSVADPSGLTDSAFPVWRPNYRGRSDRQDRVGRIQYRDAHLGRQRVLEGGFDLVHVHASTLSPLAFLVAQACAGTVPTALTVHSLWSYATPLFTGADAVVGWHRWPLAFSAVSSVAASGLDRVLARGHGSTTGAPTSSVLPNGVAAEQWIVGERSTKLKTRPNTITVVSTMRLSQRKRPLQLLRTMRDFRAHLPGSVKLRLVIIGDGPLESRMRRYLNGHGMQEWVHLAGRLSPTEIRDQYEQSDIYISPAKLESFGIAALEARCAGLPVVAFRTSGSADFIRHRHEGLLVDNDREMIAALGLLTLDAGLRRRIAQRNRDSVPEQSWLHVTTIADELYRRAALLLPDHPSFVGLRG